MYKALSSYLNGQALKIIQGLFFTFFYFFSQKSRICCDKFGLSVSYLTRIFYFLFFMKILLRMHPLYLLLFDKLVLRSFLLSLPVYMLFQIYYLLILFFLHFLHQTLHLYPLDSHSEPENDLMPLPAH